MVFKGNPFFLKEGIVNINTKPEDKDRKEIYPEIKKRIPSVQYIDGDLQIND